MHCLGVNGGPDLLAGVVYLMSISWDLSVMQVAATPITLETLPNLQPLRKNSEVSGINLGEGQQRTYWEYIRTK